ncbi:MAG: DUF3090 domain-containing protein [Anaerolineales bacterium]
MTTTEYNLKPVDRITTGAIGSPGKRVFYLQARKDDQLVTLIVEKQQIQQLAVKFEEFLAELSKQSTDLPDASSDYKEKDMTLEQPIDPAFRVGLMGLGYDEETDLLVLVVREVEPIDASIEMASVARFWCTRSQVRNMCQWCLELASRGRPICGNCGQPIDPEGHFCPKGNGHKR